MSITENHLVDALFAHASIGVLAVNQEGEIVLANPYLLSLFGYTNIELFGKKIEVLIPARFTERHVQHRSNFSTHMQTRPMGVGMDLYGVRKNGTEFPVEVSLCHYNTGSSNYVVALITDITIRKKAEDQVRRLNDELENM